MNDFNSVNLQHPQQDVHQVRRERSGHHRYQTALQLLPPATPGVTCLEVGGGRSEFARQLSDQGYQVTITDLNPSSVQFAQQLGFQAHQQNLNDGLPLFADAQFDGVTILEVIEHVVAVEFLLQEMYRVLKPGGFLILSTPNFVFWVNRLRILLGNLSVDEGYHYRFFTVKSLTHQLKTADFHIQDWRFTTPAFGINKLRRWFKTNGRKHLMVPRFLAPLMAQTMIVRAIKPHT